MHSPGGREGDDLWLHAQLGLTHRTGRVRWGQADSEQEFHPEAEQTPPIPWACAEGAMRRVWNALHTTGPRKYKASQEHLFMFF